MRKAQQIRQTLLLLSRLAQCLCRHVCRVTCCAVTSQNSGPELLSVVEARLKVLEVQ